MLLSTDWLKETYAISLEPTLLAERLTMAGLEVDSVKNAAPDFSGIIIGEVLTLSAHPNADKLQIATVSIGNSEPLQIVCGAPNVKIGIKVPVATIGAVLPGNFTIKKSKLRGIESWGMLCSARELGISEDHTGLLILSADAPVGENIRQYLHLDDVIIDIDLTPNRADCFSMLGLAREITVLCASELGEKTSLPCHENRPVTITSNAKIEIDNQTFSDAPIYLARVIHGVDVSRPTPTKITEKLRRAGIRSHDPLVDITNYVMLELGTPMHAFDADKICGNITIRRAQAEESLCLLNNHRVMLDESTLIIADEEKPLAIAGVMGGANSACSTTTQNVILEAAWFNPITIAGKARQFGLSSDSAQRFERGVDYTLQETALNLATQLISEICGGEVGTICRAVDHNFLPVRTPIHLPYEAISRRIGRSYDRQTVNSILARLGCQIQFADDIWTVTPPPWRFDLAIAEDLIEEIARIDGYHNIADRQPVTDYQYRIHDEYFARYYSDILVAHGFQEAITYSFIDRESQQLFAGDAPVVQLQNPISTNLAEMRRSLLPALVSAVAYNQNRQQYDIRLFETGRVFLPQKGHSLAQCLQQQRIAGVMSGLAQPEQWNNTSRKIDFFDVKGIVETLLQNLSDVQYRLSEKSWLHPGKSADIFIEECYFGCLGALHPLITEKMGIKGGEIYVFELNDFMTLPHRHIPHYQSISKYPIVRRDLALVVDKNITAADILTTVRKQIGTYLADTFCFDLYRGESLGDKQSIAIAILLQNKEKTLQDEEVEGMIAPLIKQLNELFAAELR